MDALGDVDARLDVGVTQDELSDLVGEASVAHSRLDVDALGTGHCLAAGAKLENALNTYSASVVQWNDCLFGSGFSCSFNDIETEVQRQWLTASRAIDRAENDVDRLDPASDTFDAGSSGGA